MDIKEIKRIARDHGIRAGKMKKDELIRAIQREEGNFDCFGSAHSGHCSEGGCLWRDDCLKTV